MVTGGVWVLSADPWVRPMTVDDSRMTADEVERTRCDYGRRKYVRCGVHGLAHGVGRRAGACNVC